MNVSELGDGVPKCIIHLPQCPVAAMDMGDGDVAQMGRRRRRECLDAVSHHQHHIRLQADKFPSQRRDCPARRDRTT